MSAGQLLRAVPIPLCQRQQTPPAARRGAGGAWPQPQPRAAAAGGTTPAQLPWGPSSAGRGAGGSGPRRPGARARSAASSGSARREPQAGPALGQQAALSRGAEAAPPPVPPSRAGRPDSARAHLVQQLGGRAVRLAGLVPAGPRLRPCGGEGGPREPLGPALAHGAARGGKEGQARRPRARAARRRGPAGRGSAGVGARESGRPRGRGPGEAAGGRAAAAVSP